jgi:hypothetical protein
MRRRLEAFIPIVLLAVMVQLIAPIAAFRAVADAISDPLYMAAICSGMGSSEDAQTAPANSQHDRANCCAFCSASYGGAVALDRPFPDLANTRTMGAAAAAPIGAVQQAGHNVSVWISRCFVIVF